jgi:hypothetical protein
VHRLDQINAQIPANLLDMKEARTKFSLQRAFHAKAKLKHAHHWRPVVGEQPAPGIPFPPLLQQPSAWPAGFQFIFSKACWLATPPIVTTTG